MPNNQLSQKTSTFFSVDLTIGNWRWWFGIIVVSVFTLSMVLINAKHHTSLVIIVLVTLALSYLVKPRVISRQDYGFTLLNPIKTIVWTLLACMVFSALVYWFEHSNVKAMQASKDVMESLGFGKSYNRDLLLILTVGVFAPINEELIYRGVIFRGIWNSLCKQQRFNFGAETTKKWISFIIATAVSSYLFMTAHGGEGSGGQDVQIYMILLLGIIACVLYVLTGSLLAPIMFHSLNNTFALWQSLDAGHMMFATQAGALPLSVVMYLSPVLVLGITLLLWALIKIIAHLSSNSP